MDPEKSKITAIQKQNSKPKQKLSDKSSSDKHYVQESAVTIGLENSVLLAKGSQKPPCDFELSKLSDVILLKKTGNRNEHVEEPEDSKEENVLKHDPTNCSSSSESSGFGFSQESMNTEHVEEPEDGKEENVLKHDPTNCSSSSESLGFGFSQESMNTEHVKEPEDSKEENVLKHDSMNLRPYTGPPVWYGGSVLDIKYIRIKSPAEFTPAEEDDRKWLEDIDKW